MLKSFLPIINKDTRGMIIGTMPGVESLKQKQYYAFKHNVFWKIIAKLFNDGKEFKDYEEKKDILLKHNIGLWDVLASCEREGSLDSNIRNAQANDFPMLFAKYPKIKILWFNGKTAFRLFKKYHPELLKEKIHIVLPSTSPANAGLNQKDKTAVWSKEIKDNFLLNK